MSTPFYQTPLHAQLVAVCRDAHASHRRADAGHLLDRELHARLEVTNRNHGPRVRNSGVSLHPVYDRIESGLRSGGSKIADFHASYGAMNRHVYSGAHQKDPRPQAEYDLVRLDVELQAAALVAEAAAEMESLYDASLAGTVARVRIFREVAGNARYSMMWIGTPPAGYTLAPPGPAADGLTIADADNYHVRLTGVAYSRDPDTAGAPVVMQIRLNDTIQIDAPHFRNDHSGPSSLNPALYAPDYSIDRDLQGDTSVNASLPVTAGQVLSVTSGNPEWLQNFEGELRVWKFA